MDEINNLSFSMMQLGDKSVKSLFENEVFETYGNFFIDSVICGVVPKLLHKILINLKLKHIV